MNLKLSRSLLRRRPRANLPLRHMVPITILLHLPVDYMIVPCPACQTRFNVNVNALGDAGRKVRCINCGEIWHQIPAKEFNPHFIQSGKNDDFAPAGNQIPKDGVDVHVDMRSIENLKNTNLDGSSSSIMESKEEITPNQNAKDNSKAEDFGSGSIVWLLLIVVLCGVCGLGYFYRVTIIEVWPPAGRLFETIGLSSENSGLIIQNVTWNFKKEDGKLVLVVTGQVTNNSQKSQSVPNLLVKVLDDRNHRLFSWTMSTTKSHLDSGHTAKFFARRADPPAGGKRVIVELQVKT